MDKNVNNVNVRVAVRCRPLSEKEKKENKPIVVQCKPKSHQILLRKKTYTFDHVFGQYTTQKEIFKAMVQPVVMEALDGYNCTIFAYGQTGTGKTHTIQGDLNPEKEEAGITPRAVRYIFDYLQEHFTDYSVRVSFLQLYNEELSDLLQVGSGPKLRLMEDLKKGGIYCQNLQEIPVQSAADVLELLVQGVSQRATAETNLNEFSSRSHCIFTLKLHTKESVPGGDDLLKTGKLNLVDLAGSECIGRSGARHNRAREAGNINQSLLTLGRVITALVDNHPHVPYRDSKLTRLLQESLGGKAKTTIIATLAPVAECVDETTSTLDYAMRAKNIKNKPEVNQRMTKHALIKDYASEIDTLREALHTARERDGIFLAPAKFAEMQERLSGQRGAIDELEGALTASKSELMESQELEKKAVLEWNAEKVRYTALQGEYNVVTVELEKTGVQLQKCNQELSQMTDRMETYKASEATLLSAAQKAHVLFTKSENQGRKWHTALVQYEKMQGVHQEYCTALQTSLAESVATFEGKVRADHVLNMESFQKTMHFLTDAGSSHESKLSLFQINVENKMGTFLSSLQAFMTHCTDSEEHVSTTSLDMATCIAHWQEDGKQKMKHVVNTAAQVRETIDALIVQTGDRNANQLRVCAAAVQTLCTLQEDQAISTKTVFSNFQTQLQHNGKDIMKSMNLHNDKISVFGNEFSTQLTASIKTLKEHMGKELDTFLALHVSKFTASISDISNESTTLTKTIDDGLHEMKAAMDGHFVNVEEQQCETTQVVDDIVSKMELSTNELENSHSAVQSQRTVLHQSWALDVQTSTNEHVAAAEPLQRTILGHQNDLIEAWKGLTSTIKNTEKSLMSSKTEWKSKLKELQNDVGTKVVHDTLTEFTKAECQVTAQSEQQMTKVQAVMAKTQSAMEQIEWVEATSEPKPTGELKEAYPGVSPVNENDIVMNQEEDNDEAHVGTKRPLECSGIQPPSKITRRTMIPLAPRSENNTANNGV